MASTGQWSQQLKTHQQATKTQKVIYTVIWPFNTCDSCNASEMTVWVLSRVGVVCVCEYDWYKRTTQTAFSLNDVCEYDFYSQTSFNLSAVWKEFL